MHPYRFAALALLTLLAACRAERLTADTVYRLQYSLEFAPAAGVVRASLDLEQPRHLLRELEIDFDGETRWGGFEGDGELEVNGEGVRWRPPPGGGELRWVVRLAHRRNDNGYDAYMTGDYAVFRGSDVFPAARTVALKGARAQASLTAELPRRWSMVTPYPSEDGRWIVRNPDRRFDRPTGWMLAGRLGVRRDRIAGTRVAIAAPRGADARPLDLMAFLNWTLPELKRVFPKFPGRLTVVQAGEPLWRGALSGPASFYLHVDRPMVSGNATSTVLHELVHVAISRGAARGADWIVEGLAEYYSVELLWRAGALTRRRYENAMDELEEWGREAKSLRTARASGPVTARAVTVMRRLDEELRSATDGKRSLDDVAGRLSANDGAPLTLTALRRAAAEVAGREAKALADNALPGY